MAPKRDRDASEGLEGAAAIPAAKSLKKNPTVLQRVTHVLRTLNVPSSAIAIVKGCASDGYDNNALVRKAIKTGLASRVLIASSFSGSKFWFHGEEEPIGEAKPVVTIEDRVIGKGGEPIVPGDNVCINYELYLASNRTKQVEKGKKFQFVQGAGDVIKGMDAGVLGVRKGGIREVIVPWELGYGKKGSSPDIPPCSDLVFVITAV